MTINLGQILSEKKVYIIAALIALISAAQFLGWIPMATAVTLIGLLTGTGVAANRIATAKAMKAFNASKPNG